MIAMEEHRRPMNINDNDVCLTRNEKRNIAALLCRSILVENFQPFWRDHLDYLTAKLPRKVSNG